MGSKPSLGYDRDSEKSERLVNLESTAQGESDDSTDDGSSESGMILQYDSPNIGSQNAQ